LGSGSRVLRGNAIFRTLGVASANAERCRQCVPTRSVGTREGKNGNLPSSSLHHSQRTQAGDFGGEAGAMDYVYYYVYVFVGCRLLFG
jgi:hypothetical protein